MLRSTSFNFNACVMCANLKRVFFLEEKKKILMNLPYNVEIVIDSCWGCYITQQQKMELRMQSVCFLLLFFPE